MGRLREEVEKLGTEYTLVPNFNSTRTSSWKSSFSWAEFVKDVTSKIIPLQCCVKPLKRQIKNKTVAAPLELLQLIEKSDAVPVTASSTIAN